MTRPVQYMNRVREVAFNRALWTLYANQGRLQSTGETPNVHCVVVRDVFPKNLTESRP